MTNFRGRNHRCDTGPVQPDDERERLRETFDQVAESYDRIRPEYPEALFDDLVAVTGLVPGDRVIEVGCATGKATRPMARLARKIFAGRRYALALARSIRVS